MNTSSCISLTLDFSLEWPVNSEIFRAITQHTFSIRFYDNVNEIWYVMQSQGLDLRTWKAHELCIPRFISDKATLYDS